MKANIDKLRCEIQHSLAQQSPTIPELAAVLSTLGLTGVPKAIRLRNQIIERTKDITLSPDERAYAQQQLDDLPSF
ncbi:hypothetical protein [Aeromonas salmonicida]|uniref:hypothetical protein n=1 Tax=Aeromonas salmonicida TaxID=645 RepID=UPI0038D0FD99